MLAMPCIMIFVCSSDGPISWGFKFSSRMIRTKNLCCQPQLLLSSVSGWTLLTSFGFGKAIVSVLTESLVWLIQLCYTVITSKGSSNYPGLWQNYFASALIWPLATCKTIPVPTLRYARVCGTWWDMFIWSLSYLWVVDVKKELKQQFLNKQ